MWFAPRAKVTSYCVVAPMESSTETSAVDSVMDWSMFVMVGVGALGDGGDDLRAGGIGEVRREVGRGVGALGHGVEEARDRVLLRGDADIRGCRRRQPPPSARMTQDEDDDEDLEPEMAVLAADLHLLAILLDHLGFGEGEEAGIRGVGHEGAGFSERVERVDGRADTAGGAGAVCGPTGGSHRAGGGGGVERGLRASARSRPRQERELVEAVRRGGAEGLERLGGPVRRGERRGRGRR